MRPWVSLLVLSVASVTAARAGEDPLPLNEKGDAAQNIVVTGSPVSTGPVDGPIPGVGLTSPVAFVPATLISPFVAHEGQFTWGPDLFEGGTSPFTTTNEGHWKTLFDPVSSSPLEHTAAPAFAGYMLGALETAHDRQEEFRTAGSTLENAFDAFKAALGPAVDIPPPTELSSFVGYEPLRARWLSRRFWAPELIPLPEIELVYPDYRGFQDIRERGARLYCAARRGQVAQSQALQQGLPASSLGERSAFSFNVFGHTIDLLSLNSTVLLNGPDRCTGGAADGSRCPAGSGGAAPNDGAQAFSVPLLLGHRLTPIRGLGLPGFAEIQVPLVLVSGDSEVQTRTDKRPVFVGYQAPCPSCIPEPHYVTMHSKAYKTVTHTDSILSAQRTYSAHARFPIFFLGPAVVSLLFDLTYDFGKLTTLGDRVIQPTGTLAAWPPSPRPGWLFTNGGNGFRYHDGRWLLRPRSPVPGAAFTWRVMPHGDTQPLWREPVFPLFQPHDIRAVTDDDHGVTSQTLASVGGAIEGALGGSIGPFETKLTVTGGFNASLEHEHVVRDALMAQVPPPPLGAGPPPTMRPITALSVRARAKSELTFSGLHAELHFHIDIPFFDDIDFTKSLFTVPSSPIATSPWTDASFTPIAANDDALALRLGTGSKLGNPMIKPLVASHLPQSPDFWTFDDDVPTCLADPEPNPPLDEPCPAEAAQGGPPQGHVCWQGPTALVRALGPPVPANVCTNIPGYVATLSANLPQRRCVRRFLAFLCTPTSKTEFRNGVNVVSRLWDFDLTMEGQLQTIVDQCVQAFVPEGTPNGQAKADQLVKALVNPAACNEQAEILDTNEIFAFLGNTQSPPVATASPACSN